MCRSRARIGFVVRFVLLVALLLAGAQLPAAAVDVEPYLLAGYSDGDVSFGTGIGCVALEGQDCPTSASTDDGNDVWGLGAAVRVAGPWWFDLRFSQQDTEVRFFDSGRELALPGVDLEVSQLHAGVLYRFLEGRWSPFLTAFGGYARLDGAVSTVQQPEIDLERASGGLGGGVMVDLGERFGLRFEVRGTRIDLPSEFDSDLEQVEGSAGVRFRI